MVFESHALLRHMHCMPAWAIVDGGTGRSGKGFFTTCHHDGPVSRSTARLVQPTLPRHSKGSEPARNHQQGRGGIRPTVVAAPCTSACTYRSPLLRYRLTSISFCCMSLPDRTR